MSKPLKVLFIADIVGDPGLKLLETILPGIIDKYQADFVVANAENSHEGRGINKNIVKTLYQLGVHVITGGNHSFDKWKIFFLHEGR
jgi:2',3'-cyclic-nucleotide 2'-phosphodiesterase